MSFGKRTLTREEQAKLHAEVTDDQVVQAVEERMTGGGEEDVNVLGTENAHTCICGELTVRRGFCVLCTVKLKRRA